MDSGPDGFRTHQSMSVLPPSLEVGGTDHLRCCGSRDGNKLGVGEEKEEFWVEKYHDIF